MNDELELMWKDAVMAFFKLLCIMACKGIEVSMWAKIQARHILISSHDHWLTHMLA
jgi:hypothetical protein